MVMWAAGMIAMLASTSAGAVQYNVINLGTVPGGTFYQPRAINERGDVVGFVSGSQPTGFRWNAASGIVAAGKYNFVDVNESGTAVGRTEAGGLLPSGRAVKVASDGNAVLVGSGTTSFAWGINDAGDVVGQSGGSGFYAPASAGVSTAGSILVGVNNAGVAAGTLAGRAGRWSASSGWSNLPLTGYGMLSAASRINAIGDVVGVSRLAPNGSSDRATVWFNDGTFNLIGVLNPGDLVSSATAINASRTVVGWNFSASGVSQAFKWTASSGMAPLDNFVSASSGWQFTHASGINDKGQIIGWGSFLGQQRGFLLDPITVTPPGSAIPEPATWAMLIAGFGLVGASLRRRRSALV
jgi:probable HAF family extracellular repeat protein